MFEIDLDGEVTTLDGYDAKNAAQVMLFGKGGLDPEAEHTLVSGEMRQSGRREER